MIFEGRGAAGDCSAPIGAWPMTPTPLSGRRLRGRELASSATHAGMRAPRNPLIPRDPPRFPKLGLGSLHSPPIEDYTLAQSIPRLQTPAESDPAGFFVLVTMVPERPVMTAAPHSRQWRADARDCGSLEPKGGNGRSPDM